jgi:hypothetical protein
MTNVYGQSRYAPISTGVDLADKLSVKTDELFSYYKSKYIDAWLKAIV